MHTGTPSQEYLNECLLYDADSGVLTWRERPEHHFRTRRGWRTFLSQKADRPAGGFLKKGKWGSYHGVRLDKTLYLSHRIIWVMVNGYIPDGMEIDHIDGNTENNRISNLRAVSSSDNSSNSKLKANNTSGHHGVYWNKKMSKWCVQIWKNKQYYGGGSYAAFSDAVIKRDQMERELGFHDNHGRAE